jgi:hypothetical protein
MRDMQEGKINVQMIPRRNCSVVGSALDNYIYLASTTHSPNIWYQLEKLQQAQ